MNYYQSTQQTWIERNFEIIEKCSKTIFNWEKINYIEKSNRQNYKQTSR